MKCTTCATELDSRATFCPNCGATVPDPILGMTIGGRYEAAKRIAIGSFGSIYRGTEVTSGKEIALKIMHRELAGDSNLVERFRREGVVLRKLLSRNVPKTFELGEADGLPFIAMEMLYGQTLLEMLRKNGPLPWKRMFRIGAQVCNALGEAHDLGIVHRDLKPANIFVTTPTDPSAEGEVVKVLDFGIAKILSSSELANPRELTIMGTAVGTLEYMAPEQLMGGRADGRTDIFTLGVVMYEMITGRRPFNVAGLELLTVQLTEPPPKPSEIIEVPSIVDDILLKCMHADIDERYQDVRLLARAFDEIYAEDDFEPPVVTPKPPLAPKAPLVPSPSLPPLPARPMAASLPLTPPMIQTEPVRRVSPSRLPYVIVAVIVVAAIIAIVLVAK